MTKHGVVDEHTSDRVSSAFTAKSTKAGGTWSAPSFTFTVLPGTTSGRSHTRPGAANISPMRRKAVHSSCTAIASTWFMPANTGGGIKPGAAGPAIVRVITDGSMFVRGPLKRVLSAAYLPAAVDVALAPQNRMPRAAASIAPKTVSLFSNHSSGRAGLGGAVLTPAATAATHAARVGNKTTGAAAAAGAAGAASAAAAIVSSAILYRGNAGAGSYIKPHGNQKIPLARLPFGFDSLCRSCRPRTGRRRRPRTGRSQLLHLGVFFV